MQFTSLSSGILVPAAPDSYTPTALQGVGEVPTFTDLWEGPTPDPAASLQAVQADAWIVLLSGVAMAFTQENMPRKERDSVLAALFDDTALKRLHSYLNFKGSVNRRPLDLYPVLLTIEWSLALAPKIRRMSNSFLPEQVRSVAQTVYMVWQQINATLEGAADQGVSGVMAALTERSALPPVSRSLVRAYGCWLWNHSLVDKRAAAARHNFDRWLNARVRVDLASWVRGISVACFMNGNLTAEQILQHEFRLGVPMNGVKARANVKLRRVLDAVSTTLRRMRRLCERAWSRNELKAGSLIPLKVSPCLSIGLPKKYLTLSRTHLAEAALERPLFMAPRTVSSVRDQFGYVVEAYVHGILARIFGDRYQRIPEAKTKRADGVIWYDSGFIVVECKARRVPEGRRYRPRTDDEYLNELNVTLKNAVKQIQATRQGILSGPIENRCPRKVSVAGALIVSWQECHRAR